MENKTIVYKFGGASLKDAESLINATEIISECNAEKLVVVVSAMGKTTNALEQIVKNYISKTDNELAVIDLKKYHVIILNQLFDEGDEIYETVDKIFGYLNRYLESEPNENHDLVYDQIVPVGELLSSKILDALCNKKEIESKWTDVRRLFVTDLTFKNANVNWTKTTKLCKTEFAENQCYITQGFIAGTKGNYMTTLGREGSDYSASIIANVVDAGELIIWKDVDGILNADPKFFNNTEKLDHISYKEAIELAYFGASVIHPKTIKPIQNKNIPLYIKSFINPTEEGSLIDESIEHDGQTSSFIFKSGQVLISVSPKDFSFIDEENISLIFGFVARYNLQVSIMQNSAINFSFVVDDDDEKLPLLVEDLKEYYTVLYNAGLDLLTIRHYKQDLIDLLSKNKQVLLEQRTRNTVRLVMK